MCDDTVRHKEDYPKLWDEIPDIFKNTANNTFVIDLRGRAVMGADPNNPLGAYQDDQVKSHTHGGTTGVESKSHTHDRGSFEITGTGSFATSESEQLSGAFEREFGTGGTNYMNNGDRKRIKFKASAGWSGVSGTESQGHTHSFTTGSNDTNATENRVKNVRMNWIIKY